MGIRRILLSAVLFAFALAVVTIDSRRARERAEDAALSARLLAGPIDRVVSLEVFNSGLRFLLRREGDAWLVARIAGDAEPDSSPPDSAFEPADLETVATLLDRLDAAEFAGAHVPSPDRLADYGLAAPPLRVAILTTDASGAERIQRIAVGGVTPVADEVYARLGDDPEVVTIPASLVSELRRPFRDFRDRRLFPVDFDRVFEISLTREGETMELARAGSEWRIVRPGPWRADAEAMETLLQTMRSTQPSDFVETDTLHAQGFGLEAPELIATVGEPPAAQGGEPRRATLVVGRRRAGDAPTYYARRHGDDRVLTVPQPLVDAIRSEPTDLRSRAILSMQPGRVRRFVHRMGSARTEFARREDGTWFRPDAPALEIDSALVDEMIDRTTKMRVARHLESPPLADESGLTTPNLSLVLADDAGTTEGIETGSPKQELVFARRVGAPGTDAAAGVADGEPFLLDGDEPVRFFLTAQDFERHELFEFDPKEVARIELRDRGQVFVFRSKGDYWTLEKDGAAQEFQVRAPLVERFAMSARGLKWKRRLDPANPGDLEKIREQRIESPETFILLYANAEGDESERAGVAGRLLAEIGQGGQDRTRVYVRTGSGHYAVDKAMYAAFLDALLALLQPQ